MDVIKVEAGYYLAEKNDKKYLIIKDSYLGGWGIFDYETSNLLINKNTKKNCIDFIEGGFKDLSNLNNVPNVSINTHFKYNKVECVVVDVVYSTMRGCWDIKYRLATDVYNENTLVMDLCQFENDCV